MNMELSRLLIQQPIELKQLCSSLLAHPLNSTLILNITLIRLSNPWDHGLLIGVPCDSSSLNCDLHAF